jgi:hypothetical protein
MESLSGYELKESRDNKAVSFASHSLRQQTIWLLKTGPSEGYYEL